MKKIDATNSKFTNNKYYFDDPQNPKKRRHALTYAYKLIKQKKMSKKQRLIKQSAKFAYTIYAIRSGIELDMSDSSDGSQIDQENQNQIEQLQAEMVKLKKEIGKKRKNNQTSLLKNSDSNGQPEYTQMEDIASQSQIVKPSQPDVVDTQKKQQIDQIIHISDPNQQSEAAEHQSSQQYQDDCFSQTFQSFSI